MLIATKIEVATHGAVLQVDIGLVVVVLGGDAVQPFDFDINAFVLLELVVFL
ncbi:hypothetical protein D3C75_1348390 [compost metagenome]